MCQLHNGLIAISSERFIGYDKSNKRSTTAELSTAYVARSATTTATPTIATTTTATAAITTTADDSAAIFDATTGPTAPAADTATATDTF